MEATADLEAVVESDTEMKSTAKIETAADSETTANVRTDASKMETTIDVDCTRDMARTLLIPSTPTSSRQKKRPIPVSIDSLRHDHHYENSSRSLKYNLPWLIRRLENKRKNTSQNDNRSSD